MANSLTTAAYANLSTLLKEEHNVTILNPLSSDLSVMRQSLLFSGLEAISYNINRKNADLKLFEFGKSYHKYLNGYEEHKHMTLFITGNRNKETWTNGQQSTDFFLLKGYVKGVLTRLGIDKILNIPSQSDVFSEGTAIGYGHEVLVEMGVVKKSILKHFGIKQEVFYADFNWDLILKIITGKIKYTEIPKYPEVRRDLALLVDQNVTYDSIYNLAKQTEKALLKDVNLFDVYEGKNLPEGKKSYALSFTIQDNTKTLTDSQIDKIMGKLQQSFETELGASLR
jgi:phenylalanyl-tRNA synthetase beta chain